MAGTALFKVRRQHHSQGWLPRQWKLLFCSGFELKDFVKVATAARHEFEKGPEEA